MGPTWGPSGADRTQVGPILAPWTLLSGLWWPIPSRYIRVRRLQSDKKDVICFQKETHDASFAFWLRKGHSAGKPLFKIGQKSYFLPMKTQKLILMLEWYYRSLYCRSKPMTFRNGQFEGDIIFCHLKKTHHFVMASISKNFLWMSMFIDKKFSTITQWVAAYHQTSCHIEAEAKWPPSGRWHIRINFLVWKSIQVKFQ